MKYYIEPLLLMRFVVRLQVRRTDTATAGGSNSRLSTTESPSSPRLIRAGTTSAAVLLYGVDSSVAGVE